MTWWIVLLVLLFLLFVVLSSALNRALLDSSDSGLERRLAEKGRLERSRWLIGSQDGLAAWMAIERVCCEFIMVGLLVWELGPIAGLCSGGLLVWLSRDVISPAVARYTGESLVVTFSGPLRLALFLGRPFHLLNRLVDEIVRRLSGANLRERDAEEELQNKNVRLAAEVHLILPEMPADIPFGCRSTPCPSTGVQ